MFVKRNKQPNMRGTSFVIQERQLRSQGQGQDFYFFLKSVTKATKFLCKQ